MDKNEVVQHAYLSKNREIHALVELDRSAIARMIGLPSNLQISTIAANMSDLKLYIFPKDMLKTGDDFKAYGDSLALLESRLAVYNNE